MPNDTPRSTFYRYEPPTQDQPQQAPSFTPRADRLRERLTPLHERLAVALSRIPEEIKADGLKLAQVWPLCIGQQRTKPTAHAVADALRQLGWTRKRYYSDSTPSTTIWFPPAKETK